MLNFFFGVDTSKWNMAPKYRARRAVVFGLLGAVVTTGIYLVATNLYWTAGGYCWGDYLTCMGY